MPDSISSALRNSTPQSLRTFIEDLEADRDEVSQDRARKLSKDPDAKVEFYDRKLRDIEIRIEVASGVAEAYCLLSDARDATRGQSDATTRVELSKLLLRIDEFFAKKA